MRVVFRSESNPSIAQTSPFLPSNSDDFPGIVLESLENMRVYMPGLANICPCTSDGYNLEQIKKVNYRDWRPAPRRGDGKSRNESDNKPPSPQAGGFSYLSNAMFVATRDIPPGEELVVECEGNTDMFDPGDYPPVHFVPEDAGGYSVCLDDRVEERLADHTPNVASAGAGGDGYGGGQRGLFARRKLKRGESLTSTPMIPVHKNETNMDGGRQQLLLNYMFGHPESSLLWLPQAPLILAANHYASYGSSGDEKVQRKQPNAKVQWHSDEYTKAQAAGKPLSRRQQFHHAELLKMESVEVVQKHGMGLMIDLVATQTIDEGEEVLVDYGEAWDEAMKAHILGWDEAIAEAKNDHEMHKLVYKKRRKLEHKQHELAGEGGGLTDSQLHHHRQRDSENALSAVPFSSYVTASDYNELHANDDIRTISEQHRNPYPSNIETACHFEYDWLDDEINDDPDADRVTFESWYNQNDHFDSTCLLPCIVTERREYVPGEEKEARTSSYYDDYDDDGYDESQRELDDDRLTNTEFGGSFSPKRYTAKLVDAHELNTSINFQCHIYKRFEYIYIDIPREGIVFIDKPHSSDQWIEHAFRQPIGLPDEMVPQNWRDLATQKKGMRGGRTESKPTILSTTAKNAPMTKEEKEYQLSVKRWNMVETRRERLDETADKRQLDFSAREDL